MKRPKGRCYLVYALAPQEIAPSAANDALNDYIEDRSRGMCVYHDHFIDRGGGIAVFDIRNDAELAKLEDLGPLQGWDLSVHP